MADININIKDIEDIEAMYSQLIYGYDEPDMIWSNGHSLLDMRAEIGITDVNDSNGDPIVNGQYYSISRGGITLPVGD